MQVIFMKVPSPIRDLLTHLRPTIFDPGGG
jgi:hypothetical protein